VYQKQNIRNRDKLLAPTKALLPAAMENLSPQVNENKGPKSSGGNTNGPSTMGGNSGPNSGADDSSGGGSPIEE
jgi:hypothetical protein